MEQEANPPTSPPQGPSGKASPAAGDDNDVLYIKHQKVYPRRVTGVFARLRVAGVLGLLGLYYFVPWMRWDGRQAVLFDLPARKFYIFGLTFWPQDFFYLSMLLIIAALSLFFFTALAGRLWCGYACPQTVWTEVFLWIERRVEGDRNKQMKRDQAPWSLDKALVKTTKHVLWIAFAAWTGFTFVGYFTPITELASRLVAFSLGPWETFWVVFYSFATYGNAGWLREQVCIYMCPYARFQSAMFDKNTLIISYDTERGEPRGSRKRGTDIRQAGLGECVDCTLCVQVCPTGIDIRNGLQYQCIGCAACVDVCGEVMQKMGYPPGLIRYTTENALEGRAARLLRPRVIIYALLLLGLSGAFVYGIADRVPLRLDVIRDRNTLYRETADGWVENSYSLKVINMDDVTHRYRLSVSGIPEVRLGSGESVFTVPAGELRTIPVQVQANPDRLAQRSSDIEFRLQAEGKPDIAVEADGRFLGPVSR